METPVWISCDNDVMAGIVHRPEAPATKGVLIVVGGPQYRVGSHRQFVLLARALTQSGFAVLRFDYRGMGDSGGTPRDFENIQDDIRSAADHFLKEVPALQEVVIWALCDGASAALFYAPTDSRITGLILLNPWVRTEQSKARAYITHYYHKRFLSWTLWRQVFKGEVNLADAIKSMGGQLTTAFKNSKPEKAESHAPLPQRMLESFSRFGGQALIILSGNDLTAQEFTSVCRADANWTRLLNSERITLKELARANHTFSTKEWRDQINEWTATWLRAW